MSDHEDVSASIVDLPPGRAKHIEDDLGHAGLELVNMASAEEALDESTTRRVSEFGGAAVRAAALDSELSPPGNGTLGSAESPAEVGRASESKPERSGRQEDLYAAIVDPATISFPPLAEGEKPIEVAVTSDNTIEINGYTLDLRGQRLFIVNALFMHSLGNAPMSAEDIRSLGFRTTGRTPPNKVFGEVMRSLTKELAKEVPGIQMIERTGKAFAARYSISQNILLIDRRSEEKAEISLPEPEVKVGGVSSEEETESDDPRDRAVKVILDRYQSHPRVQSAVDSYRISDSFEHRKLTDIYKAYRAEVDQYRQLPKEERTALMWQVKEGYDMYQTLDSLDDLSKEQEESLIAFARAYQIMVHTNQGLVLKFSQGRYVSDTILTRMELIQEGNIGLSKAIIRFDVTKGLSFANYAVPWIKQAIGVAIIETGRTIRLPAKKSDLYLSIQKKVNTKEEELAQKKLTDEQIEEVTGMSLQAYNELIEWGSFYLPSLNSLVGTEEVGTVERGDLIPDPVEDIYSEQKEYRELRESANLERLREMIERAQLSDKEKLVIGLQFGLSLEAIGQTEFEVGGKRIIYSDVAGAQDLLVREIAEIVGVPAGSIAYLRASAFAKIESKIN